MTTLGSAVLILAAILVSGWILDLVRCGRLYVGYGIVVLALIGLVVGIAALPGPRVLVIASLEAMYPREPIAVIGLGALLLLLVYVLHQLSVLSDRVATLTQEIALRNVRQDEQDGSGT